MADVHRDADFSADVALLGAGPAGLALARSMARRGLRVSVVAPGPEDAWPRNYGCFLDELAGLPERAAVEHRFDQPRVWLGEGEPLGLPHPYVKLGTAALQRGLLDACRDAGVEVHDARATDVRHHAGGSVVALEGAGGSAPLATRLVVDASGFGSRFVSRHGAHAPAYQAAYGEVLEVEGHPFAPGEMSLMDYRAPDGATGASATFGYVMPLSPTRIFVEETSLVARPAMDHERLRVRFGQRVARLGLRVRERHDRELCLIPMGMPLPLRRQRTVAFGAAASLVHPATGYQVARALRLAEPVAGAIAQHLDEGPERASRAAYEVLWPEADLRAWALYRFGMDFLADQPPARTTDFLRAFFGLPEATWLGYMTGRLSPSAICSAMLGVFRRATLPLKTELIRAGAGPGSQALLRAARPDNPL